ncbi:testis-specific serine/threonine-protein kinase 3-like [Argiope bruennichi]|nr:testis-specific serine/threonine-protein kinase 3-like [Argiope bruennichi]
MSGRFLTSSQISNSVYMASLAFYGFHILREELGDGNYGKVKRATHRGKDLAVKIINRDAMPSELAEKFLSREIEILRKVQHKNIVHVYRIFDYPRKVYIFMEFVERGNLYDFLKEKIQLSESESRYIFRQIVSAIKYLHYSDIAHRDIKCENVMLTNNAEVKLIDFGFCRRVGNYDELSCTFCGSTAYAAPEVLQGIPYDPFKYDIWSLGCVLYVMATGTMPFNDMNVTKMVEDQLNKVISYPRYCQLTQCFLTLMDRMLEPDVLLRATILHVERSLWLQIRDDVIPDMSKKESGPSDDGAVTPISSDYLGMIFEAE